MTEQRPNWAATTAPHSITQHQLDAIRQTVAELGGFGWANILSGLIERPEVNRRDIDTLANEFNELNGKGKTLSAAGLLGAWEHITKPEMVRAAELAWLQKLVVFGERVSNAMMALPLDYKGKEGDPDPLENMRTGDLVILSRFRRAIDNVRQALPDKGPEVPALG